MRQPQVFSVEVGNDSTLINALGYRVYMLDFWAAFHRTLEVRYELSSCPSKCDVGVLQYRYGCHRAIDVLTFSKQETIG